MNATTPDPNPTELAETRKAIGERIERPGFDPADYTQVMALALRLRDGGDRALMRASLIELRALANLAVDCGCVALAAVELFAASDRGCPPAEARATLENLAAVTRPLMGEAA
jgi:hypothetical protein